MWASSLLKLTSDHIGWTACILFHNSVENRASSGGGAHYLKKFKFFMF